MTKPVKLPDASHPITITPSSDQVSVTVAGRSVAESRGTVLLKEAVYPAVRYIPRRDVDMNLLQRTTHQTYCPYKGDCSYYSVPAGGERSVNAAWSYENPHPAMAAIAGHLAFYPDRVEAIEVVQDPC